MTALSGGAFNPAVGFGPVLVDIMNGNDDHPDKEHPAWIYWVGPLLGALIAAVGFRVTNHNKEYADMTALYPDNEEPLVSEETI